VSAGADRILRAIRDWCFGAMVSRRAMRVTARMDLGDAPRDLRRAQPRWFIKDSAMMSEAARAAIDEARFEYDDESPEAYMAEGDTTLSNMPTWRREAAIDLWALMSDISEECWCAGWMASLSHFLWDIAMAAPASHPYGQGEVSAAQAEALRALSAMAGGWWIWCGLDNPDGGNQEFLPIHRAVCRFHFRGGES